jgi:hypothetical protein
VHDALKARRGVGLPLRALPAAQIVIALWLMVSPVLLDGPRTAVAVKDMVSGAVLLAVTLGALVNSHVRRWENATCVLLGALLIVAALALEFGPGPVAASRQLSEVVVGVVLVCLAALKSD